MSGKPSNLLIASALRESIRGYNFQIFKHDLIAGIVVSLLSLPLAMALAISVGLPPQHGIYTAIVGGAVAAIFGGSKIQVNGPTAAFVVIVAPIISQYGLHGIIWCQIMAGFILLSMGILRLGRYVNYVPYPVTTGFTAGIALVIATLAMNDFFGLGIEHLTGDYVQKVFTITQHMPAMSIDEFMVGAGTLLVIIFFGRITNLIPSSIIGIAVGTAIAYFFIKSGHDIATIGSRFSYDDGGLMKQGIPPYPPVLHWPSSEAGGLFSWPDYNEFRKLLVPSFVIAALAALESLLSATVADSMAGTKHNPNSELNGVGLANIFSGMVAGIPATGAIARSSLNVHSGGRTPFAALINAIMIMFYVMFFAPVINYIPMAALAALLINTAYRMSHVKQFIRTFKIAPRSDVIVLLTCFLLTVFIDMVAGVGVGMVMAAMLFMKNISDLTQVEVTAASGIEIKTENIADNTMIYKINGPVFFGTVEKLYERYNFVHDHIEKLVIDMENVPLIDMTGLVAMKKMLIHIAKEGREVFLCGKNEVVDRIMLKIADCDYRGIKTARTVKEIL